MLKKETKKFLIDILVTIIVFGCLAIMFGALIMNHLHRANIHT